MTSAKPWSKTMDVREKLMRAKTEAAEACGGFIAPAPALRVIECFLMDITAANLEIGPGWCDDMSKAPKDRTWVQLKFRDDLAEYTKRSDLHHEPGAIHIMRHPGLAKDGFDMGWGMVGVGGYPDDWFSHWKPITPPAIPSEGE